MTNKLKISGNGMADIDGDVIWITIESGDAKFTFQCDADKAELLQEAFLSAIAAGLRSVQDDHATAGLRPIEIW